ncbi:MAG: XRE family transcriptional regulator [Bacteroidetes bacterium HGW-Bacteroidetes-11]|jgi:transcriptional regulator with XRE-family HTH domain|nr:MAG: XRE family transcriptional regulator [Bacteroidetes bacterium HGW-Bacteroidetes-11]
MQIGKKIRKVRELRNFTQDFMAKGLGITQEAYSRLESGQTRIDVNRMEKIANILDIDPISLMNFDVSFFFNNRNQNQAGKIVNNHHSLANEERKIYLDRIANLEKEIEDYRNNPT